MYVNNSYLSEMNIMSQAKKWKANQWKTMPINKVAQSTDHTRFVQSMDCLCRLSVDPCLVQSMDCPNPQFVHSKYN